MAALTLIGIKHRVNGAQQARCRPVRLIAAAAATAGVHGRSRANQRASSAGLVPHEYRPAGAGATSRVDAVRHTGAVAGQAAAVQLHQHAHGGAGRAGGVRDSDGAAGSIRMVSGKLHAREAQRDGCVAAALARRGADGAAVNTGCVIGYGAVGQAEVGQAPPGRGLVQRAGAAPAAGSSTDAGRGGLPAGKQWPDRNKASGHIPG